MPCAVEIKLFCSRISLFIFNAEDWIDLMQSISLHGTFLLCRKIMDWSPFNRHFNYINTTTTLANSQNIHHKLGKVNVYYEHPFNIKKKNTATNNMVEVVSHISFKIRQKVG